MKSPLVSVIIPSKRKTLVLQRCLKSLEEQDYPKELFEVIVASPEPLNVNDEGLMNIRTICCGQANQAEARNIAETLSNGEILAFCDDDCVVPSSWIRNGLKHFQNDKSIATVGGPSIPPLHEVSLSEKITGLMMMSFIGTGSHNKAYLRSKTEAHFCSPTEIICANMFVDRAKFHEAGGFSGTVPQEEDRLNNEFLKRGYRLMYDPECYNTHYQRSYGLGYLKNIFSLAKGRAYLTMEERKAVNKWYFIPSFFVLGLTLGPLLFWVPLMKTVYFWALFLYIVALFSESLKLSFKVQKDKIPCFVMLPFALFTHHFVFGIGSLYGYLRRISCVAKAFPE